MTASAGAWYRVGTVNVTNGQQSIVGVGTNWQNDVIAITIGDIFTIDSKTWYEVTAVNSDTGITLDRDFEGATTAGANYAIVRNTSGTILTRIAGQISVQFNQKQLFLDELRTWLNSDSASEELTDSHGVKQELKTPAQMVRDHDDKLAELDEIHPYPWAMRKVEFEARRAVNNEKFAASGYVHKGKVYSAAEYTKVAEGLFTDETTPNILREGRKGGAGSSKSDCPVIHVAGVVTKLEYLCTNDDISAVIVKFPQAEDGTRTYDSATGVSVTHATPTIAFASETATNKVVTDRVDMRGYEPFLREINDADPFVYGKGLIQSQASNINGIPTVDDNVRPLTYFAWYEGDDSSRGKGVNWQTASEAQRIAIASDPENNIYFDDSTGKFYQWCVRGRSFAGLGNGDWGYIDVQNTATLRFDISTAITEEDGSYFSGYNNLKYHKDLLGCYQNTKGSSANRDIFFLVCGTVNRLNQGAYHPSYNPSGAAYMAYADDPNAAAAWHHSLSASISNKSDTFTKATESTIYNGSLVGSGAESGRPDGRYYDAVYASGQGGVCSDMRYSAWGLKSEDFAEADLKVKSGEYRGKETQKITSFYSGNVGGNTASGGWQLRSYDGSGISSTDTNIALNSNNPPFAESLKYGKIFSVTIGTSSLILQVSGVIATNVYSLIVIDEQGSFPVISGASGQDSSNLSLLIDVEKTTSIVGEYTHTEVIGNPANILLCDDLKDGWVGSWNPNLPDGLKDLFQLTQPYTGSGTDILRTFTTDNGGTWSSSPILLSDPVLNSTQYSNMPANQITLYQYKTKAGVTKNSVNSEIYGGKQGIGSVFITQGYLDWAGADLGYSLIGKILDSTGDGNSLFFNNLPLKDFKIYNGKLGGWTSNEKANPTHATDYNFGSPENSPVAFKALDYKVVENQQGFINYAYTELKHNGTDWGDDGKIHIVDNQTTMLDENGNTVLVGTAQCVEPLGWIKNDK